MIKKAIPYVVVAVGLWLFMLFSVNAVATDVVRANIPTATPLPTATRTPRPTATPLPTATELPPLGYCEVDSVVVHLHPGESAELFFCRSLRADGFRVGDENLCPPEVGFRVDGVGGGIVNPLAVTVRATENALGGTCEGVILVSFRLGDEEEQIIRIPYKAVVSPYSQPTATP